MSVSVSRSLSRSLSLSLSLSFSRCSLLTLQIFQEVCTHASALHQHLGLLEATASSQGVGSSWSMPQAGPHCSRTGSGQQQTSAWQTAFINNSVAVSALAGGSPPLCLGGLAVGARLQPVLSLLCPGEASFLPGANGPDASPGQAAWLMVDS